MVSVVVADLAAQRVGRDGDHRDARAVAEEVDRLAEAGVEITAAFVEGDDHERARLELRVGV